MRPRIGLVGIAVAACGSFEPSPSDPTTDGGAVEASAPFCATERGTACEDFDDSKSGTFPKTEITDGSNAQLDVVSDLFASSPSALRLRMPVPSDATCRYALRYVELDKQATNGVKIEYKIRPSKLSGAAYLGAAAVLDNATPGIESCGVYLQLTAEGGKLIVSNNTAGKAREAVLNRKAPLDAWTSVVIDVTGLPGGRRAKVTFDGVEAVDDGEVFGDCQNGTRLTKVDLGIRCANNLLTGDLDVAFDDVRVTVH